MPTILSGAVVSVFNGQIEIERYLVFRCERVVYPLQLVGSSPAIAVVLNPIPKLLPDLGIRVAAMGYDRESSAGDLFHFYRAFRCNLRPCPSPRMSSKPELLTQSSHSTVGLFPAPFRRRASQVVCLHATHRPVCTRYNPLEIGMQKGP